MNIWLALSTIASLLLGTPQLNWIPFHSRDGRFVVTMPDTPRERVKTIMTVHGPIAMHEFIARPNGSPAGYLISYNTLSPAAARRPVDITLNGVVNGAARGIKGHVATCCRCSQQGFPGRDFTVTNAQGALCMSHAFIANGRLYQVNVWALDAKAITPDATKFIGSFKLITRR